jgi:hypothetical protein
MIFPDNENQIDQSKNVCELLPRARNGYDDIFKSIKQRLKRVICMASMYRKQLGAIKTPSLLPNNSLLNLIY